MRYFLASIGLLLGPEQFQRSLEIKFRPLELK